MYAQLVFALNTYKESSGFAQISLCLRMREKGFCNAGVILFRTQCEDGVELRKGKG
jgi:hypothetical protein